MIDPTKFLPDREVFNVAARMMSDLLAVETNKGGLAYMNSDGAKERLQTMASIAYKAAFALLQAHNYLFKEAQSNEKGRKK